MDSVASMIAKAKRKKSFRETDQKTIEHLKNVNTEMIIDFYCERLVSINSLAVNKTNVGKFFRKNAHVCQAIFNEFYLRYDRKFLFFKH